MSKDERKDDGETLDGFPKSAKLVLLAVMAVVQAIPGYSMVSTDDWHPPGMGPVFAATAGIVGAGMIVLFFVARQPLLRMRTRPVAIFCFAALVASLGLIALYRTALDARVVNYAWSDQEYRELVPFGSSRWAPPELMKRIRTANGGEPKTRSALRPSHFRRTLEEYGPGYVTGFFPAGWGMLTRGLLWANYLAVLMLIAAAFGAPAVRIGQELREKKEGTDDATEPEQRLPKAEAGPAPVGEPAPTAAPAAAEAGIIERDADDLRPPRMRSRQEHSPSRNGKRAETALLRVEVRGAGWLVLGAAALAIWATKRARDEADRGSRPR